MASSPETGSVVSLVTPPYEMANQDMSIAKGLTTELIVGYNVTFPDNDDGAFLNGTSDAGPVLYQSFYLGYLWLALIFGLPGNILISVVYAVVKQKRTSDWFILYLAIYDGAVCVFAVPLYLSIETGVWITTGSVLACKIEQFTIFTSQFSSVSILGIIAVDRYLKICHPTKKSLNARQARNVGLCTPLLAAAMASPILFWMDSVESRYCQLYGDYRDTFAIQFHLVISFLFYLAMFVTVTFCYFKVIVVVRRRVKRHRQNAIKRRHMVGIPEFLRAISSVENSARVRSSRATRAKRKFSLFSMGSNRRLSVISPWMKARLSLPNENNQSPQKSEPLDEESKKATRESLTESKKFLDRALSRTSTASVAAAVGREIGSASKFSVNTECGNRGNDRRGSIISINSQIEFTAVAVDAEEDAKDSEDGRKRSYPELSPDVPLNLVSLNSSRRHSRKSSESDAYTQSWTQKHGALWQRVMEALRQEETVESFDPDNEPDCLTHLLDEADAKTPPIEFTRDLAYLDDNELPITLLTNRKRSADAGIVVPDHSSRRRNSELTSAQVDKLQKSQIKGKDTNWLSIETPYLYGQRGKFGFLNLTEGRPGIPIPTNDDQHLKKKSTDVDNEHDEKKVLENNFGLKNSPINWPLKQNEDLNSNPGLSEYRRRENGENYLSTIHRNAVDNSNNLNGGVKTTNTTSADVQDNEEITERLEPPNCSGTDNRDCSSCRLGDPRFGSNATDRHCKSLRNVPNTSMPSIFDAGETTRRPVNLDGKTVSSNQIVDTSDVTDPLIAKIDFKEDEDEIEEAEEEKRGLLVMERENESCINYIQVDSGAYIIDHGDFRHASERKDNGATGDRCRLPVSPILSSKSGYLITSQLESKPVFDFPLQSVDNAANNIHQCGSFADRAGQGSIDLSAADVITNHLICKNEGVLCEPTERKEDTVVRQTTPPRHHYWDAHLLSIRDSAEESNRVDKIGDAESLQFNKRNSFKPVIGKVDVPLEEIEKLDERFDDFHSAYSCMAVVPEFCDFQSVGGSFVDVFHRLGNHLHNHGEKGFGEITQAGGTGSYLYHSQNFSEKQSRPLSVNDWFCIKMSTCYSYRTIHLSPIRNHFELFLSLHQWHECSSDILRRRLYSKDMLEDSVFELLSFSNRNTCTKDVLCEFKHLCSTVYTFQSSLGSDSYQGTSLGNQSYLLSHHASLSSSQYSRHINTFLSMYCWHNIPENENIEDKEGVQGTEKHLLEDEEVALNSNVVEELCRHVHIADTKCKQGANEQMNSPWDSRRIDFGRAPCDCYTRELLSRIEFGDKLVNNEIMNREGARAVDLCPKCRHLQNGVNFVYLNSRHLVNVGVVTCYYVSDYDVQDLERVNEHELPPELDPGEGTSLFCDQRLGINVNCEDMSENPPKQGGDIGQETSVTSSNESDFSPQSFFSPIPRNSSEIEAECGPESRSSRGCLFLFVKCYACQHWHDLDTARNSGNDDQTNSFSHSRHSPKLVHYSKSHMAPLRTFSPFKSIIPLWCVNSSGLVADEFYFLMYDRVRKLEAGDHIDYISFIRQLEQQQQLYQQRQSQSISGDVFSCERSTGKGFTEHSPFCQPESIYKGASDRETQDFNSSFQTNSSPICDRTDDKCNNYTFEKTPNIVGQSTRAQQLTTDIASKALRQPEHRHSDALPELRSRSNSNPDTASRASGERSSVPAVQVESQHVGVDASVTPVKSRGTTGSRVHGDVIGKLAVQISKNFQNLSYTDDRTKNHPSFSHHTCRQTEQNNVKEWSANITHDLQNGTTHQGPKIVFDDSESGFLNDPSGLKSQSSGKLDSGDEKMYFDHSTTCGEGRRLSNVETAVFGNKKRDIQKTLSTLDIPMFNPIHSTLVACIPSIQIGSHSPKSKTDDSGNETCKVIAKSVFDAFCSSRQSSTASDPCLNFDDELNLLKVQTPSTEQILDAVKSERLGESADRLTTDNLCVQQDVVGSFPPQRRHSSFQTYCKTIGRFGRLARRANGRITHSWYSLDDLDDSTPKDSQNAKATKFARLSQLRMQINEALSVKNLRRVFSLNPFRGAGDRPHSSNFLHGGGGGGAAGPMMCKHIDVVITRCESLVMDNSQENVCRYMSGVTLDPSTLEDMTFPTNQHSSHTSHHSSQTKATQNGRSYSVDTPHSSLSRSDDQSLVSRSQDTSRVASLDLLSPMSASMRGSVCSGLSSASKMTDLSAYTENSRSDCEKITRRTAEREHNITKLLGVITLIFVVSWSVSWSVVICGTLALIPGPSSPEDNHVMVNIARNLFLVNHFCNVVVYTVLSKSFREKLCNLYHIFV